MQKVTTKKAELVPISCWLLIALSSYFQGRRVCNRGLPSAFSLMVSFPLTKIGISIFNYYYHYSHLILALFLTLRTKTKLNTKPSLPKPVLAR